MSLLIRNATIATQNDSRDIIRGDILADGERISRVGPGIKERADEEIDAAGMIAIPGLVNAHSHVSMTLMRGYGEDMDLHSWLERKIWPAEARQTKEQTEAAALLAFCEMIRGGTTSFSDMCVFDTAEIFKAASALGMRGLISRTLIDFGDPARLKAQLEGLERSLTHRGINLTPCVSAHAPYTCSEEALIQAKGMARKKGLRFQIHVSETRKEIFDTLRKRGKYPYEYLESIGLMDKDSIFVHGGWLTRREMALAGKSGVSVASCPVSNLKLATGGIAQLVELDSLGANVCLGTDSAVSNNSLDMFQSMKMATLLQKHHYWKADIMGAQKAFDFATLNGAKAIGMECGAIAPGMLADIVLLEQTSNMIPAHDIPANIVYSAGPQNVRHVIIAGKTVLRDRRIIGVDEGALIRAAERLALDVAGSGSSR